MPRLRYLLFALLAVLLAGRPLPAQISFTSAIDLALRNSPRVKMAEADVNRARASLAEAQDVFVPSLVASNGLGYSYGYPLGTPTLFSFEAQSLVFNYSQHDYIRSARAGLEAANLSLADMRQQVAEDAATTYLALDRAEARQAAMTEETGYASKLVTIVQDRLSAGQDDVLELTRARRTVAQLHLQQLQMEDEIASYQDHLDRLIGMAGTPIATLPGSIPEFPSLSGPLSNVPDGPAVLAAFANARSKQLQAFGDSRYTWRPQIAFAAQYSRFSTFNNYQLYYPAIENNYNAIGVGVQIQLPFFDAEKKAHARQTAAEAVHAAIEANYAQQQQSEGRLKLEHGAAELEAKAELASLDRDLAQEQLDAVLVQLQAGNGTSAGPQMTPKDEENARIEERQRYLELLDTQFQLRQTQITLLRQTGRLETWLKSSAAIEGTVPQKP